MKASEDNKIKMQEVLEKMDSLNNRIAVSLMDLAEKEVKPSI